MRGGLGSRNPLPPTACGTKIRMGTISEKGAYQSPPHPQALTGISLSTKQTRN